MVCPCKPKTDEEIQEVYDWSIAYQDALTELVESDRYETNEDFTVTAQPFLRFTVPPRDVS